MKRYVILAAVALALTAGGAIAKDKPQPKMKSETIAAVSTQNSADPTWLPFLMMMIVLIGLLSGGSGAQIYG